VAIRIVDGEVVVRSPGRMAGYLADDGSVRRLNTEWLPTGDLGELDQAGNLQVIGRREAVHRMGYTIYPESLRRQAERCGQPVVVIGVADERRGAHLVFFVEDPMRRPAAHWRDRINGLLADYERPNVVEVLDRFPLNNNGKVDRAALTALAAAAVAARRRDGDAA
jgi:acyl-CoA synthetase (AMP-forming)/AMP-acid ligase II